MKALKHYELIVIIPPILKLLIDGIIVKSEPLVKLFGIHIDERLTFTYHFT